MVEQMQSGPSWHLDVVAHVNDWNQTFPREQHLGKMCSGRVLGTEARYQLRQAVSPRGQVPASLAFSLTSAGTLVRAASPDVFGAVS